MGRLSEYINGFTGTRPSFLEGAKKTGGLKNSTSVEIYGADRIEQMFDHLLTTDPDMARLLRKLIAQAMKEVRSDTSKDIAGDLKNDPRKAYRAVKHSVYKRIFGGNVSILQKRRGRAGATKEYNPTRKLVPGQRGGNRIQRSSDGRNRLDKYFGSDRGFALRFINSGTEPRTSRWGARGAIAQRNMFGRIAPWHMEQALEEISQAITTYISQKVNG